MKTLQIKHILNKMIIIVAVLIFLGCLVFIKKDTKIRPNIFQTDATTDVIKESEITVDGSITDEVKADEVKADEVKADEVKADEVKADETTTEVVKQDTLESDNSKTNEDVNNAVSLFSQENPNVKVIQKESFDRFQKVSITQAILRYVEKNKADSEGLDSLAFPSKWAIDWSTFFKGCKFGKHDKGFEINSPNGALQVYWKRNTKDGKFISRGTDVFCVKFTVSNLSKDSKAHLGVGIKGNNSTEQGFYRIYKNIELGESQTEFISFETNGNDDFISFAPMISVTGNVVLEEVEVLSAPAAVQ